MRESFSSSSATSFWVAPLVFGLTLIAIGVLIIVYPRLLSYAVASLFVIGGVFMIGVALSMRTKSTVTFYHVSEERTARDMEVEDDFTPPQQRLR